MTGSSESPFTGLSITHIAGDGDSIPWDQGFSGSVSLSKAGDAAVLTLTNTTTNASVLQCLLTPKTVWRANSALFLINPHPSQPGVGTSYAVKCPSKVSADGLQTTLDAAVQASNRGASCSKCAQATQAPAQSQLQQNGFEPGTQPSSSQANGGITPGGRTHAASGAKGGEDPGSNHFDAKIDKGSAELYFHYYGMIMHQQNMLQDYQRTGTYYQAILGNPADFLGKTVMDVGAGSGILSLFAAQAGARRVYAVEASGMAAFARDLADANPALGQRLEVINSKVEEVQLPERVDVLVSEPMGTLLVNERMLETYLYARDHFLKPGGKMFPQLGRIHTALFSDEVLYAEIASKAAFWMQPNFYGVDVSSLYGPANESYFAQVVVDAFEPTVLVSSCASHVLDFATVPEAALLDIHMPLQLMVAHAPCTLHGVACWFDVLFDGSQSPIWLSTAPGQATTHWFQLRCVLQHPLFVTAPNTLITGTLHLKAHARQSYDIHLTITAPPAQVGTAPQTVTATFDLKEPYYRQLTTPAAAGTAGWWGQDSGQQQGQAGAQ